MSFSEISAFLLASTVLAFTPGPDILFVIVTSLSQGFRTTFKFILGLSSGVIVHTTLIVIGISTLIRQSHYGVHVLQVFAAGYLLWLAYKTYIHRLDSITLNKTDKVENYFFRGFFMNVSNPKVMLFFLAFFPQFANLEKDGYQVRLMILGLLFISVTIVAFSIVAWITSKGREKLIENPKFSHRINWFAILVFVGVSTLLIIDIFT